MVSEEASEQLPRRQRAVVTPPLMLEGGLAAWHRPPNLMQRILTLFKNVRPGSDLAHIQCYGESVYCVGEDMLGKCAEGKSGLDRFTSVVAWFMSTIRPPVFGLAPYNPVLGETHHVSHGTLNVLLEQVSHHPPVTALHATDTEGGNVVELVWCQHVAPRFTGTGVEAQIKGKRQLKLPGHGECYEMTAPALTIRLLPAPSAEWTGNISVRCKETGLRADLRFHTAHSLLGFGGIRRSIKGGIFDDSETSSATVSEIYGQWDRTVMLKDARNGEVSVLYRAEDAISKLTTPAIKDYEGLAPTESVAVWAEVSQAVLAGEWDRAREAKRSVEERARTLQRERSSRGERWVPRHFTLEQTKDGGWDCRPKEGVVSPAAIVVVPSPKDRPHGVLS